ncbi:MAG TPA: polysaccharide biosynthesis tyrosine autokinase [Gemmatimonadota bacterium]|nr:polysaccharide biosynthesis tyrosine autokinase [Gemmatimonadota bacterium]
MADDDRPRLPQRAGGGTPPGRFRLVEMEGRPVPGYPSPEEEIGLQEIWAVLRRRKWTILTVFALVVGAAALYTWTKTPVWQADTTLRIEENDGSGSSGDAQQQLLLGLGRGGQVETEMRVVETRPILTRVAEDLSLPFRVTEPEGIERDRLFPLVAFGRKTPPAAYRISQVGSNRWRLVETTDDDRPGARIERTFTAGDTVELPGGRFVLASDSVLAAGGDVAERLRLRTTGLRGAADALKAGLSVTRPDPNANLIRIEYSGTDRWQVRDIPNAVATAFVARRQSVQKTEARSTVAFLTEQSARIDSQLRAAEDTLQAFREAEQVVAPEAQADAQVQRLADLKGKRADLASERDALQNLVGQIESGPGRPDWTKAAAFPTFLSNKSVQDLLQKLTDAEQKRTEMLAFRTEKHPDLVALDRQIDQLEGRLGQIARDYLGSLSDQIASIDTVLDQFGTELARVPGKEVRYARLQRRSDLLTQLNTMLQQRLKEAQISAAVEDASVRVVESAVLPDRPIAPKPVRNLALGGFLGLLLGVGLAFVREYTDRTLHADEDVEALVGAPVLARVPPVAEAARRRAGRADGVIAARDGRSLPAESFRSLRTNVRYTRGGEGAREILVTSPGARDGKSLTASNLAVTLAQQGTRTLLVDADLRKAVQHQAFGVDREPGLAECLVDGIPLRSAVRATDVEGLDLLPAGAPPPNPAELLGSERMERLLGEIRQAYAAFVIDTPPALVVTDASVLASRVQGTLVVVRAERTVREGAEAAVEQLRRVGAEVLGVVLNDASADGRYGYHPAYYGEYFGEEKTGWRKLLPFG